jgi:hypothetical protein
MSLPRDIFGFLGLAPRFGLEDSELERRQRELTVARQAEGPRALEQLNEAVRALKDPATRAEHLFELHGWPSKGAPDPILLERIFTDREFIDLARKKGDKAGLDAWMAAALPRQKHVSDHLTRLLDGPSSSTYPSDAPDDGGGDARRALLLLEELRFLSRAVAAARAAIDALEDAAADESGT